MSYSDILNPRREVLREDGIEGIIDLTNLADPKRRKLETRPADFFDLTYPTADVRRVLETLHRRFTGSGDTPGLVLLEGLKGSGKSHLLLLVYHLIKNTAAAAAWLQRHSLAFEPPQDAVVVVNKFTDLPLESIWDYVFRELTGKPLGKKVVQPSLEEVQNALGNRSLVLILDELEQGIRVIADDAARSQNIAFLQMLSEWGNRESRVTLVTSIYSDEFEPGSTLMRVKPCRVRFEQAADKARVVLHRLFQNYLDVRPERFRPTVESYLSAWRRHDGVTSDALASRMGDCFPFSPDLLDVILERVPVRGGFQNVRGALGFLARLVKLTHQQADLITPAHADLVDQEIGIRLEDLDPSRELIRKARENLRDLKADALLSGMAATVMLYTLSGSGQERGATREHLVRACCGPVTDINDFERSLRMLQQYASYFHHQEGRFLFDREENPNAKVELRSLTISDDSAKAQVAKLWREELFRDPESAVIYVDAEQAKADLEEMEKGRLRFVLAPRRLKLDERHLLYHGLSEQNQVILLEPRDAQFHALTNRDLLKWAKRVIAADELAATTREAERKADYERIGREDRKNILDQLRRAGLYYVRVDRDAATAAVDAFEEESLGPAVSKEEIVRRLFENFYPTQRIAEHIQERMAEWMDRSVRDVDRDYRTTLGFPVPTHEGSVRKAIRELCRSGVLGINHPRGYHSGREPDLTDSELMSATLAQPRAAPPPREQPELPLAGPQAAPVTPAADAPPPAAVPAPRAEDTQEIRVPPQPSPGALRHAVAMQLQAIPEAVATSVRFKIYLREAAGDLGGLPPAFRGSVSGPGELEVEINIRKEGPLSKGDLEQLVERLPSIAGAQYDASLKIAVPAAPAERAHRG